MGESGLKWRVNRWHDGTWTAWPLHSLRRWTVCSSHLHPGVMIFGPEDAGWFDTFDKAIAYAADPHHAYLNGWMP